MKKARTFIAISPGKKIRDRLLWLQNKFAEEGAQAKWVEHDNLHVTLLFLGEVGMVTVPQVCKAVARATEEFAPFNMTIEGVGCFPTPRRPRVLWVGVGEGREEVTAIHDALEEPLMDLGCYRREERRYVPHLTIGRIQGNRNDGVGLEGPLEEYADWKAGEITVKEILVMGSELTRSGPIYSVLSRAKLH